MTVAKKHFISLDNLPSIGLSRKDYKQILRIVKPSRLKYIQSSYEDIKQLLSPCNIRDEKRLDSIARILLKNNSISAVKEYLRYRDTSGVSITELLDFSNYIRAFNIMGFDTEVLNELFNLLFNGRSTMGKGEILINTLVKNAVKPQSRGDVLIDNIKYDVKIERARFRGQKGFNNSSAVSIYLSNILQQYIKGVPPGGSNNYHPTTKKVGVYFDITLDLINQGIISTDFAVKEYKTALLQAYPSLDCSELNFVDNFYKTLDNDYIIKELPRVLTKYYLDVEQLNGGGVICMNQTGSIRLLTSKNLHTFDLRNPSFGYSASNQGSAAMLYSLK